MKKTQKTLLLGLLVLMAALLSACSGGDSNGAASGTATAKQVPVVLNQVEYALYQNIFINGSGSQYENQAVTKQGVFARIYDAFSNRERYYVWGYLDNTRCCDWQWEFTGNLSGKLPANGSLVTVRGAFKKSDDALDGYWIENAQLDVQSSYVGETAEYDMCAMSDTLERVQLMNIVNKPEQFEGKHFAAYGRIYSPGILQDPYYDGSWQVPFSSQAEIPAIGTTVVLRGVVASGVLSECSLTVLE